MRIGRRAERADREIHAGERARDVAARGHETHLTLRTERIVHAGPRPVNRRAARVEELPEAEAQQILATMIKQRRDSIDQFTKGNRPELAAAEAAEIVVIEEFLPQALDESALQALVAEAVADFFAEPRNESARAA